MDRLTFLSRLRQSRLLGDDALAAVTVRFPPVLPAQAVAAALIQDGTLTRFQAQRLWSGQVSGLVLGQYRLMEELGRGGFGQVYKASHTLMGRVVALKVISPHLVQDRRARDWFKREVLAVTQLCHPHIVMAYDADEVGDVLFLAMEFVDGPSLEGLVRERGPLPAALAAVMMQQAAQALQYAHEKGVVHRDIKPGNVLVSSSANGTPVVKVVDFGLARLQGPVKSQTLMPQDDKNFVGTPDFVSPEQARNVHAVDIRSDLYSLACTFYYALSGQRPFPGTTVLETVVKHLQEEARPLEALCPEVPPELAGIIRRCMAKEPADRLQSPAELVAALEPLCQADQRWGDFAPRPAPAVLPASPAGVALPATALVPDLAFWSGPGNEAPRGQGASATPPFGHPREATVEVPAPVLPQEQQLLSRPLAEGAEPIAERPSDSSETASARAHGAAPGAGEGPATLDRKLRESWRQWLDVVEVVAGGRRAQDVGAGPYRELHGRLLTECRAALAQADGPLAQSLGRMEALVEPWLTLYSLASADPAALTSLLARCRDLDREIGGPPGRWGLGRVLGLLGGLAIAVVLASWASRRQDWLARVRPWGTWTWSVVQHQPLLVTAIALPLVLLTGICLFSRLFRA